ncbi:MAG: rhodanese-like domain-containing protein [Roseimicrobium sp.]
MEPTRSDLPQKGTATRQGTLLREVLVLALCTLLAAAGTHLFHPRAPAWFQRDEPLAADEVTLDLVAQRWHGQVLWIDARPRADYVKGHAPGALLLNEEEANQLLFDHFEQLQDNNKPIVVYCDDRACQASRKMAAFLRERLPSASIYVLRGGWAAR